MSLIMFAGLPGTGKSTLAEALGKQLQTPVFALDWLLGALAPFYLLTPENAAAVGTALLTTLAQRQLDHKQSVILDSPAHTTVLRMHWHHLAIVHQTAFFAIETCCSDSALHRERVEQRVRSIPGWHEISWTHVERMCGEPIKLPSWYDRISTRRSYETTNV